MATKIIGAGNCCIDLQGANSSDRTPIIIWGEKSSDNQMWEIGIEGHFLSLLNPTKCLSLNMGDLINEKNIILDEKISPAVEYQQWDLYADGYITNRAYPNYCIEVRDALDDNRTPIQVCQLGEKNNLDSQKWHFLSFANPVVKLIIGLGGKCIAVKDGNSSDGAPIILQDRNRDANQMWNFTDDGFIESFMYSNKCLDIQGGISDIGTHIVLMEKNGAINQKWDFNYKNGQITSRLDPNRCLVRSVRADGSMIEGSPIVLWNIDDPTILHDEDNWQIRDTWQPLANINLSYKILTDPLTGDLPRPDMIENIHLAVADMNSLCMQLNTSFRFNLIDEPAQIGGPGASGHVNFWYNTKSMTNEHLKSFYNSAKLFFDSNYKFDQTNAFKWRDDAINIYLTGIGWGGRSAYPEDGELIAIAVDADRIGVSIQIHEIGHFFSLHHTFDDNGDDTIADTLIDSPDPNSTIDDIVRLNFSNQAIYEYRDLSPAQKMQVDNTWNNIMSYHGSPTHLLSIFTPGQLQKWESVMRNQRANVLSV